MRLSIIKDSKGQVYKWGMSFVYILSFNEATYQQSKIIIENRISLLRYITRVLFEMLFVI